MLSRPLTLNETEEEGRGLVVLTPPPVLPFVDEADNGNGTQTGVFSPPLPEYSSSSSLPPPCVSTSSSAPSITPPFTCLLHHCSPHHMSRPSSPPSSLSHPPPFGPSPLSTAPSSHPHPPPPPPPPSVSSAPFLSPSRPPVVPYLLSSAPSSTSTALPPPSSSFSSTPLPSFPLPLSLHPPHPFLFPPTSLSVSSNLLSSPPLHDSPPFSSAPGPLSPPIHRHSSFLIFPPPPPPASSAHIHPSLISPPPPVSPLHPPPAVAPSLLCSAPSPTPPSPTPPPPACCPCSSLLPRLLSAHRLEVRRLLRGALASLSRRLDCLERRSRSRRKRRKKRVSRQRRREACSPALAAVISSSASSSRPTSIPPVISSSSSSLSSVSSDSEDSSTPLLPSCFNQSDQRRGRSRGCDEKEEARGRKRRRKNRGEDFHIFPEDRKEDEEEELPGRFIGQMSFSLMGGGGGAEKDAPLTLYNFNQTKHQRREEGGSGLSEKAASVIVRQNGYRAPLLLHSISSSFSQDVHHLLQSAHSMQTCSQSEAPGVSSSQWRFSDFTPPLSLSSNHGAFRLCLHSSSSSPLRSAPMLRLSAVVVETVLESVRGWACGYPPWPLRDWTAPPSLSSDHCYVRTPKPSSTLSTRRQQKQRANHSTRSFRLPRWRPLPLAQCSTNGLSSPFPESQSTASSEFLCSNGERGKRVSQIRIRRASPRETPLTPMGLPKVKRLKKKEFSLEEIYTNKNYKSPTTNRSLETIFEEPREKDGTLLLIGQQRRRRLLLFPDFTQPRKRKRPQGVGFPLATVPRKRSAARRHCNGNVSGDDDADLDVMLVERLSALEDFLTRQGLDV